LCAENELEEGLAVLRTSAAWARAAKLPEYKHIEALEREYSQTLH
jgi:hypothetical protein